MSAKIARVYTVSFLNLAVGTVWLRSGFYGVVLAPTPAAYAFCRVPPPPPVTSHAGRYDVTAAEG